MIWGIPRYGSGRVHRLWGSLRRCIFQNCTQERHTDPICGPGMMRSTGATALRHGWEGRLPGMHAGRGAPGVCIGQRGRRRGCVRGRCGSPPTTVSCPSSAPSSVRPDRLEVAAVHVRQDAPRPPDLDMRHGPGGQLPNLTPLTPPTLPTPEEWVCAKSRNRLH